MNSDNLIPQAHRLTVDEASKGGKKSAESRREKKRLRELLEIALELPYVDYEGNKQTQGEAVIAAMVNKAISGDMSAARTIFGYVEGLPKQTIATEPTIDPETYKEVEAILMGVNYESEDTNV